jgi:hypothetical protein
MRATVSGFRVPRSRLLAAITMTVLLALLAVHNAPHHSGARPTVAVPHAAMVVHVSTAGHTADAVAARHAAHPARGGRSVLAVRESSDEQQDPDRVPQPVAEHDTGQQSPPSAARDAGCPQHPSPAAQHVLPSPGGRAPPVVFA